MKIRKFINNYWIALLIAVQPVLDIAAYFNRNSVATVSGFIRLAILFAVPLCLLKASARRKQLFTALLVIGVYCLLHVMNGFRVGYISLTADVHYILKVIQAPVLALCFMYAIDSDEQRDHTLLGVIIAAAIYVSALLLAIVTGTANGTYGSGIGVSGWVIDGNRCANSLILVTYSVFLMYCAIKTEKTWLKILLPIGVCVLLLINGTKSCYISALGLMASYCGYTVVEAVICRRKFRLLTFVLTAVLLVSSVLVYPVTPRAIQDKLENNSTSIKNEDKFKTEMRALGYDLDSMTLEEKLSDDFLVSQYQTYYYEMMWSCVPQLLDEYGIRRVMTAYDATTEAGVLIDTRRAKRCYSSFIFEDSDIITKMVGFEFEHIGKDDERLDLENDWTSILYYYGYIGVVLYAAFAGYFLYLIIKRIFADFKGSLIPLNFSLLVSYVLLVFLAQFSGAVLRRPNVSIFFSVVLALLYYQTKTMFISAPEVKE